ncbi:MAG: ATP-binding protein, partial [Woeseiales bacterium]
MFSQLEDEAVKPVATAKSTAVRVGHIVSVSGPQAVAVLDRAEGDVVSSEKKRIEIGSLITVPTPGSSVVGIVSGMTTPMPGHQDENMDEVLLIEISLAGEIHQDKKANTLRFSRGVAHFPTIGDPIMRAGRDELACVYYQPDASTIDVGTLHQDRSVPAHFLVDELFGKHFIVVGTTGSGKSSAITCILRRLLAEHTHAHIVMLDVHDEYRSAFGDQAESVHPSNLRLPFWLLNFQELCAAFAGVDGHRDAEVEILADAVLAARRRFFESQLGRIKRSGEGAGLTVDTPSPFRLADVVSYLEEQLGKLERAHAALPYRRLKGRIEAMVSGPRFSFMFGSYTVEDTMADVLGRLFRIPSNGKPITVMD